MYKLHIFIIMFFMGLVMSIQGPIFAPYASSLGATSVFIGIMLSIASFANLTGNLIAGPLSDRFGKKGFIIVSFFLSGSLFILHGLASSAMNLLVLRTINGLSLAFLLPSALALLSGYANNSRQQGKNMAINAILATTAAIIAPIVGGQLGATIGYANTYFVIGSLLFLIAIYASYFLKERQGIIVVSKQKQNQINIRKAITLPNLKIVFLSAFAVMYIHGVVIYEVPYLTVEQGLSTATTGILFSFMGIGTLLSSSLFFINRFSPVKRMMFGLFGMAISMFLIFSTLLALTASMLLLGFFFGIMMPAMATAVTDAVSSDGHGRAFGLLSAANSVGIITSSFLTGVIRDIVSPYFVAFLVGMIVLTYMGYTKLQLDVKASPSKLVERY
ncbi:MFS transporter [Ornithinibacillus scapharcae]|uniref:MFS transporter n=1 Tax=Ornithinibacillus scapharcae TaxID=1147159 RepID=UPI000225B585|nr:MFS transporter [Ornithinibacillus scapharcae]